jgi:hypothetical protein
MVSPPEDRDFACDRANSSWLWSRLLAALGLEKSCRASAPALFFEKRAYALTPLPTAKSVRAVAHFRRGFANIFAHLTDLLQRVSEVGKKGPF